MVSKYKLDLSTTKLEKTGESLPILDVLYKNDLALQIGLNIPHRKHRHYFENLSGDNPNFNLDVRAVGGIFRAVYSIFESDSNISTFTWNKLNSYKISLADKNLEALLLEESNLLKMMRVKRLLKRDGVVGLQMFKYLSENTEDCGRLLSELSYLEQRQFYYELDFWAQNHDEGTAKKLLDVANNLKENPPEKEYPDAEERRPMFSNLFSDISKMKTTLNQRADGGYNPEISTFRFSEGVRRYSKRKLQLKLIDQS